MDEPTAPPPVKIAYFISRAGADAELAKFVAQIVREAR